PDDGCPPPAHAGGARRTLPVGRLADRGRGRPRHGARRTVARDELARYDERRNPGDRTLAPPRLLPVVPRRPSPRGTARRQPAGDPPARRRHARTAAEVALPAAQEGSAERMTGRPSRASAQPGPGRGPAERGYAVVPG